ncbi:hypothetical protein CsSME_00021826 [Camellia sinensis var. sinensis]
MSRRQKTSRDEESTSNREALRRRIQMDRLPIASRLPATNRWVTNQMGHKQESNGDGEPREPMNLIRTSDQFSEIIPTKFDGEPRKSMNLIKLRTRQNKKDIANRERGRTLLIRDSETS